MKRGLEEDATSTAIDAGKKPRPEEVTRVFVGSLSYSTDRNGLRDHFAQVGEVEFATVILKPDGQSKGCGMVNFTSPQDAQSAVALLNESVLDGRHIMVKLDVDARSPTQKAAQGMAAAAMATSGLIGLDAAAAATALGLVAAPEEGLVYATEGVHLPPEQISRVFVGNLAFSTTWQMLKDHFRTAGSVDFVSVLENPNGTSKGCGMVNFATHEEAVKAVELLNDSVLDGRMISVKLDVDGKFRERPPPGAVKAVARLEPKVEEDEGYMLPPDQICRVFVGSLSFSTTWQSLKDHFGQVGDIEFASVLLKPDRTSKGCGMVNYHSHEDALRAVELLNNSVLDGRTITVKLDVDGKFKDRPPPGARPRVHQRQPEEVAVANRLHQLQIQQLQLQRQQQVVHVPQVVAPPRVVRPPTSVQVVSPVQQSLTGVIGSLVQSPQSQPLDWLTVLGQVAQTPAANQIDWPSLISSVAASAQQMAVQQATVQSPHRGLR